MKPLILILLSVSLVAAACKRAETPVPAATATKGEEAMAMKIQSTAFAEGERIPKAYTCDGEDKSPPLSWSDVPEGTKSLALICDDPDAPMGTWVHWVLWNLKADADSLTESLPKSATLPDSVKQGKNSWPRVGYNGPCPPAGKPHRYYFKLYALDAALSLGDNTDKAALEKAMQGHILAQAQLMGKYGR